MEHLNAACEISVKFWKSVRKFSVKFGKFSQIRGKMWCFLRELGMSTQWRVETRDNVQRQCWLWARDVDSNLVSK